MYNRGIFYVATIVAIALSLWCHATKLEMFMMVFLLWNTLTIQDIARKWSDKNKEQ